MSAARVKEFFEQYNREDDILVMEISTATVQLAADALGVIPARIAKSIAIKGGSPEEPILLVAAGDARLDNKKFRQQFGVKPSMLSPEDTLKATGHAIGGVCPFALPENNGLRLALDESLKRFITVYPACGSSNSAIEVTLPQLEEYMNGAPWVDVCKDWD